MPGRALGLFIIVLALVGGCATRGPAEPAEITIAPGNYAAAFNAAREELIDLGFELERIDARLGVILTRPKSTAGLASPWDREQSTIGQEFEDLLNRQFRRAIITFRDAESAEHLPPVPQTAPGPMPVDLRLAQGPIVARVEVVLDRHRRSGWRLEPVAMRLSSRTLDPELRGTGMWPAYNVPYSQDPLLAHHIAGRIRAAGGPPSE